MEAELFHADGQTDMALLIAFFRISVKGAWKQNSKLLLLSANEFTLIF